MANFPTSVSTNANLYIAVNGIQTTLASSITDVQTTITLTSTSSFPTTGAVTINNLEVVFYTGISGADLTGCTRGADGTSNVAHNAGVTVGLTVVAAHHNLLKDEVIAVENALGAGFTKGNLTAGTTKIAVTGGTGAVIGSGSTVDLGTVTLDDLSNVTVPSPSTNDLLAFNGANWVNVAQPASSLPLAGGTMTGDITMSNDKAVIFKETTGNGTDSVTVKAPASVTTSYTIQLPPAVASAGQVLKDVAGNGVLTWENSVATTAYREDYVVGTALNNYTGSTTVFNLVNAYSVGSSTLIVTLDGDIQTLGASVDYLETNSTTVTFNNALVTGQKVSLIFQTTVSGSGIVNSGTAGQLTYYPSTGSTVSGLSTLTVSGSSLTQSASAPDVSVKDTGTGYALLQTSTNSNAHRTWVGVAGSTGGELISGSTPYASVIGSMASDPLILMTSNVERMRITTTNVTTNIPTAITGTATNDSASAGYVGQYVSSSIDTLQNSPSDGVWGDITSISLTAGDWDVYGAVNHTRNTATWSQVRAGLGTTSGNNAPNLGLGAASGVQDSVFDFASTSTTFNNVWANLLPSRVSISSTTTVYLKIRQRYSSGQAQYVGSMYARRIR